jgi:tRNA-splicing ligase RtcB
LLFRLDGQITVFGYPDGATLAQMQRTLENECAAKGVLCADNHKGYAVPIGGVVAYREAVSPSGVGFDIGCGNKAVLTDMPGAELRANIRASWTTSGRRSASVLVGRTTRR